jgi:endoglucanase
MAVMLLERLSLAGGIAGQEEEVRRLIRAEATALGLEVRIDDIGNLLAVKMPDQQGKTKHVVLCAHMDEVGMVVKEITSEGFLNFAVVGGIASDALIARPVLVGGDVPGVIGSKAIHLQKAEERKKLPDISSYYVDIGAQTKEETEKYVKLGDKICFAVEFVSVGEDLYLGKALDDRAGCALILEALAGDYPCRVTGAFTTQEEIGLRGARVLANDLRADLVLVLEATAAGDVLETKPEDSVTELGKGPAVSLMDAGTIYPRELIDMVSEIATTQGIPLQYRRGAAARNDAAMLHTAGAGLPVLTLSLPCRNIHTAGSLISARDYTDCLRLVQAVISSTY